MRSSDEPREIRARLIEIADSDRRRAEHALHDGVLQDLVAVSVRLQLARQLAETDPQGMLTLLDEIGHEVKRAFDRVRVLANEIYPSLLMARGIPDSLRAAASAAGVRAKIEADGLGRYGERIEAAVYFWCRAALEAVARAESPGPVAIRLERDGDALRCEVTVDGVTIADIANGSGMTRDRIEALGGSVVVEQAARDRVALSARVPLAQPA